MAEDDGFLGRWSRLKQAEREGRKTEPAGPPDEAPSLPPAAAGEAAEEVDLAALPPIETLGADSDYTAFLRPGVPAELQRQALRRAWVTDREIAEFRAPADYDWNFNAPGYGALKPTDNVAEMLQRLVTGDTAPAAAEASAVGSAEPPAAAATLAAVPEPVEEPAVRTTPVAAAEPAAATGTTADTGPVAETEMPAPSRRRHGGAVPV